jgi:hypothetical protein
MSPCGILGVGDAYHFPDEENTISMHEYRKFPIDQSE